jgi:uncharacterized protein (DUF1330 family)
VPAYVIVETDITDPEQYEKYKAATPGAIAAGGGRFLVRGGELAVLEGDWQPSRLVMLEFKDLAAAKLWYRSEAYQEAKKLARVLRTFASSPRRASTRGPAAVPSASMDVYALTDHQIPRRPARRRVNARPPTAELRRHYLPGAAVAPAARRPLWRLQKVTCRSEEPPQPRPDSPEL